MKFKPAALALLASLLCGSGARAMMRANIADNPNAPTVKTDGFDKIVVEAFTPKLSSAKLIIFAERHDAGLDTAFLIQLLNLLKKDNKKPILYFEHFAGTGNVSVAGAGPEYALTVHAPCAPQPFSVVELLKDGGADDPYPPLLFSTMHSGKSFLEVKGQLQNRLQNDFKTALAYSIIQPAFFKTITILKWLQKNGAPTVFGMDAPKPQEMSAKNAELWDTTRDYCMVHALENAVTHAAPDQVVIAVVGSQHVEGFLSGKRLNVETMKEFTVTVGGQAFHGLGAAFKHHLVILQYAGPGEGTDHHNKSGDYTSFPEVYENQRVCNAGCTKPNAPNGPPKGQIMNVFANPRDPFKDVVTRYYYQPAN